MLSLALLAMIRNNSYLVHVDYCSKQPGKKHCMTHKMFTLSMIEDLMEKAADLTTVELPRFQKIPSLSTPVCKRERAAITKAQDKRQRLDPNIDFDNTFFADYAHRLTDPQAFHVSSTTTGKSRGACIYCVHLFNKKKHEGIAQEWHKAVKRTVSVCTYCSSIDPSNRTHYLCKDHFATFHGAK